MTVLDISEEKRPSNDLLKTDRKKHREKCLHIIYIYKHKCKESLKFVV